MPDWSCKGRRRSAASLLDEQLHRKSNNKPLENDTSSAAATRDRVGSPKLFSKLYFCSRGENDWHAHVQDFPPEIQARFLPRCAWETDMRLFLRLEVESLTLTASHPLTSHGGA
jgi:hypothetical protein